ncbi:uncharacterized protein TNIN_202711 [Trichonephila inaurata madagascariensis]|uniref:Uncharacterized protein n=1 Tax=Trichonephila inaurata madagascariensis TaxID=2747483 RepID=A0A8X7CE50_9ARAC|nr:uncharacterized protein TNIN_202711 [Trichonephila inaurata madagascariensis]
MAEIFNYIEKYDNSPFTLKELRDVLTGDPEEEWLRIVEAEVAIIREGIRSSVVETKSYPPPSKMLIKENQEIRYGSKRLIDVLYSLGFAASYGKTEQYEISTSYHPQTRILSSESGALVQYFGDNADIKDHTLDGNNTLHVMGMIKIVTVYKNIQPY